MKQKRNLSGIYFRVKNDLTGKFENVCFEDLNEKEQDRIMLTDSDWLKALAKQLAKTINELGENLDLYSE